VSAPLDPAAPDRTTPAPLAGFGAIHRAAVRAEWAAATSAGLDIRIREGDGLLFGAAPTLGAPLFDRALGLAEQPHRVGEALAFFDEHGVAGEVVLAPADLPAGVEPRIRLEAYRAAPADVAGAVVDGFASRLIEQDEAADWMELTIAGNQPSREVADIWRAMAPWLAAGPGTNLLVGELDGRPCAAASLHVAGDEGWLSWASVVPADRGKGIQRAMIDDRARLATTLGCTVVAAWALAGAHSSANLQASGFERIGERVTVAAATLR
jgi:GNAT superfamily N-acetyltransferase